MEQKRKSTAEVADFLKNFEACEKNHNNDFPFSKLHYAFIFRRFDEVLKIKEELSDKWEEALQTKGPEGYEWITPLVCAKWNWFYICGYDAKNGTGLANDLDKNMEDLEDINEVTEYTDIVDKENNKSIFDIFWGDQQPLLDIIHYEKQELASRQVMKNRISLVMDEVGTGKTVSAIYAIRDTIEECKKRGRTSRILIVCPRNKREDWQNDIRRQLGRYAHIIEQSDDGIMYTGVLKKVFFKGTEDVIMISGQKGGGDGRSSNTELKKSIKSYSDDERWDLVVIDEGHISFNNYRDIRAEAAMLLTATPIVVNG